MSASSSLLPPVVEDSLPRKKFTRSEVYQMLEAGVFAGRRFELIHGDVIDKMGQSARHSYSITRLAGLLCRRFEPELVRVQLPIELHREDCEYSEPEPDVVLLTQTSSAYRERQPRGDEVALVVEVADTSLRGDLTIKRDLYARAAVPEYWILDVVNKRLTVHRKPAHGAYAEVVALGLGDTVPLPTRTGDVISLTELFD